MIDGISIMVCVYIVFRIIERIIVVTGDKDSTMPMRLSLVLVGMLAAYLSINAAIGTHDTALKSDADTVKAQKAQLEALDRFKQFGQ